MKEKMRKNWGKLLIVALASVFLVSATSMSLEREGNKAVKAQSIIEISIPEYEVKLVNPEEKEVYYDIGEEFSLPEVEILDQEGKAYPNLLEKIKIEYFYLSWDLATAEVKNTADEIPCEKVDTQVPGVYRIVWSYGTSKCEATVYVGLPEEEIEEATSTTSNGTRSTSVASAANNARKKKNSTSSWRPSTGNSNSSNGGSSSSISGGNTSGGNTSGGGTTEETPTPSNPDKPNPTPLPGDPEKPEPPSEPLPGDPEKPEPPSEPLPGDPEKPEPPTE